MTLGHTNISLHRHVYRCFSINDKIISHGSSLSSMAPKWQSRMGIGRLCCIGLPLAVMWSSYCYSSPSTVPMSKMIAGGLHCIGHAQRHMELAGGHEDILYSSSSLSTEPTRQSRMTVVQLRSIGRLHVVMRSSHGSLSSHGADVAIRDNDGSTPLHRASARRSMELARWADVSVQGKYGWDSAAFDV